jgi:hypothetical protein
MKTEEALRTLIRNKFSELTKDQIEMTLAALKKINIKRKKKRKA